MHMWRHGNTNATERKQNANEMEIRRLQEVHIKRKVY